MSEKNDEAAAYAGRWVARLEGRIIAHGGTPEQALRAAQKSRFKERAEITYMQHTAGFALPALVERVRAALNDQEMYLVGGAVRDALLGKVSHDLDFVVPADAIGTARRAANALNSDFYVLDEAFDAARVILDREGAGGERDVLDFTSFRLPKNTPLDQTAAEQRHVTLQADLQSRDFTINAIAYDLRSKTILDPTSGAADLRGKVIRMCSPTAMDDDAIRVLRGVRLAAALEFKIDPGTRAAMKDAATRLREASPERQRDELFKTLSGRRVDAAVRALDMLGALHAMMPELADMKGVQQSPPHVADVWEHTLSVLQQLEGILAAVAGAYDADKTGDLMTGLLGGRLGRYREHFVKHFANRLNPDRSMRALLFFAALYHDVSKPVTRTADETGRIRFFGHEQTGAEVAAERGRGFRLSKDEVERVETIISNHMRFHFHSSKMEGENKLPSRRSIYRFFRDTGEAGVDLMLLGLADLRGTRGPALTQETWSSALDVARLLLENYWEKPQEAIAPPRLVDGNEVMAELGLQPGPAVGQALMAIREAQAAGEVSSREQALEFARQWLHKQG